MTSNAGSSASGGGGGGRQKKRARVDVDEHHQATEVQLEVRTLLSEGFGRSSSLDRLFSHRIRVVGASAADGSRTFLEALQLPNGIVLLRAPFALDCSALTFDAALHCDNISGKKKKQAVVVAQGSVVVSGTLHDQTVVTLLSPVKGKLLEMNLRLTDSPQLLHTHHETRGYVAILYPGSTIAANEKTEVASVL